MTPARAVLFDAAGTLIELCEPVGVTYAKRARQHGVEVTPERIEAAFRSVFANATPMVFPQADSAQVPELERRWWCEIVRATFDRAVPEETFDDFDAYADGLFDALGSGAWRPCEGAHGALAALRERGWRLALVSNFDRRLHAILRDLDFDWAFDATVLAADVGRAKPDPAVFEHAVARLDVVADRALVVGDDPERDLAAARRLGLHAIDVRGLATLRDLPDRADALISHAAPPLTPGADE